MLSGLGLAPIAFLSEGKVEIMAIEANPVALSGLAGGFVSPGKVGRQLFDWSVVCFHLCF